MNKYPKVKNEGRIIALINGEEKYNTYFECPIKRKNYSNNITSVHKGKHIVLIFQAEGEEPIEYFNSNNYSPKLNKDYDTEFIKDGEVYFDADAFFNKYYKEEKLGKNLNSFIQPIYQSTFKRK